MVVTKRATNTVRGLDINESISYAQYCNSRREHANNAWIRNLTQQTAEDCWALFSHQEGVGHPSRRPDAPVRFDFQHRTIRGLGQIEDFALGYHVHFDLVALRAPEVFLDVELISFRISGDLEEGDSARPQSAENPAKDLPDDRWRLC